MKKYDLIQVEDEDVVRKHFELTCGDNNLSYFGAENLNDFKKALEEGVRGGVYLIDGVFPREEKGMTDFLAGEAIEAVRQYDPEANIFLYSALSNIEYFAEQLGVTPLDKRKFRAGDLTSLFQ